MLTSEQIERLGALLAEATPGPWYAVPARPGYITTIHDNFGSGVAYATCEGDGGIDRQNADAALIAEAINALPALLQLARAVNDAPRREIRECCGHLLVGNEWDEADAAINAMRGQTVALVPVPVKEGKDG